MNKYFLFFALIISTCTAYAMKVGIKEQNEADKQLVVLSYGSQKVEIHLTSVLRHIFSYQKIVDPHTEETKISGLHAYVPKRVRPYQTGRVLELSDGLWIYTEDDHLGFHSGYIIYHGKAYDQLKTFFPSSWSQEQVLACIQQAQHAYIAWKEKSDGTLRIVEASATCSESRLTFIFQSYNKQLLFKTVYPECKAIPLKRSTLDALELEQRERLKKVREERLAALLAAAKSGVTEIKEIETTELVKAIKNNEPEKLLALLKAGADVNDQDKQGITLLMAAANQTNYELINDLLEYGARTDVKDKKGRTVFDYALHTLNAWCLLSFLRPSESMRLNDYNQEGLTPLISIIKRFSEQDLPEEKLFSAVECVDILLNFGADPQKADKDGFTPLMHCARIMHPSKPAQQVLSTIVALLLDGGADVDTQRIAAGKRTGTALLYAAERNHNFLVTQLLEAQADYMLTNEKNRTARVIAHNKGFSTLVQLIDSHIKEKDDWMKAHSAHELIHAAYKNSTARVRKLLALNPNDVNKLSMAKDSALYYAVGHSNLPMVRILLDAGADPRLKCPTEGTILQFAQSLKNKSSVSEEIGQLLTDRAEELDVPTKQSAEQREIRKKRAIEDFKNELTRGQVTDRTLDIIKTLDPCAIDGESPLVCAIKVRKPRVVAQLCKKGKDFYKDGRNDPVTIAYELEDLEILRIVLKSECAREERLLALLELALRKKKYDVLDILKEGAHFYYSAFKKAIIEGKTETIERLCTYDTDLLTLEQAGMCLVEAIIAGRHKISELIINCYPQVIRYADGKGTTPLMHAVQQGMIEICRKLLQAGADSTVVDSQGRSAHSFISPKSGSAHELYALFKECASKREAMSSEKSAPSETEQAAVTREDCPKTWTQAMQAVFSDNMVEFRKFSRTDLIRACPEGLTPLHVAAIHGKRKMLAELIHRKGINLNPQDKQGRTPLYHCVERNDEHGVMKFLEKKARIFVLDRAHNSLFSAIKNDAQGERIKECCKNALLEEIGQDHTAASCEILYNLLEELQYTPVQWLTVCERMLCSSSLTTLNHVLTQSERWRNKLRKIFLPDGSCPYFDQIKSIIDNPDAKTNPVGYKYLCLVQSIIDLKDISRAEVLLNHGFLREPRAFFGALIAERANILPLLIDKLRDDMTEWTICDALAHIPGSFFQNAQNIRALLDQPAFEWYRLLEQGLPTLTPLIWACLYNKKDVVKLFITKRSPELNRRIEPMNAPAWFFVRQTYHEDNEISSVLAAWADTDEQAKKERTESDRLVLLALRKPYLPVLYFLAGRPDVDLNKVDADGNSIFFSLLKAHGKAKAKVNGWNRIFETEVAVLHILKCLIKSAGGRVNVNQPDKTGITPFEYAVVQHMPNIACYIASLMNFNTSAPAFVRMQKIVGIIMKTWAPAEILSLILERPDVFPVVAIAGMALEVGNIEFVRMLLQSKVVSDSDLQKVLTTSAGRGLSRGIKHLLQLNPNVMVNELVPLQGYPFIGTPLMAAVRGGNIDTVAFILKVPGINIHVKDRDGCEARDLARKAGRTDIVQLFDSFEREGQSVLVFHELQHAKSEIRDELLYLVNFMVESVSGEKSWLVPQTIKDDIDEFVDSLTLTTVAEMEAFRQKLIHYRKELVGRAFYHGYDVLRAPVTFTILIDCWLCAKLETKYPEVRAAARCYLAQSYLEGKILKENSERMRKWIAPLCEHFSPDKIDYPWQAYASFYMGMYWSMQSDTAENKAKALRYFRPLITYTHNDFDRKLHFACEYFVTTSDLLALFDFTHQAPDSVAQLQSFFKNAIESENSPDFVKVDARIRLKSINQFIEKKE